MESNETNIIYLDIKISLIIKPGFPIIIGDLLVDVVNAERSEPVPGYIRSLDGKSKSWFVAINKHPGLDR